MLIDNGKDKPMHSHAGLLRRLPWLEAICCVVRVLLTGLGFQFRASAQYAQGLKFEPQHCKNTKANQTLQAPFEAVNTKLTYLKLSDSWCCPEEVNRFIIIYFLSVVKINCRNLFIETLQFQWLLMSHINPKNLHK